MRFWRHSFAFGAPDARCGAGDTSFHRNGDRYIVRPALGPWVGTLIPGNVSLSAAAMLLAASSVYGQVAARVTGSVVDSSGAAVAGASIGLQLPGSNSNLYSTVSTLAGDYKLLSVNPGAYDLAVEAKGFVKSVLKGVKVDASRATDVPPIALEVASISQSIEVSESTSAVETSNAKSAPPFLVPRFRLCPCSIAARSSFCKLRQASTTPAAPQQ